MKRAFGALGTSIVVGGAVAAVPLFSAVLAAVCGTLIVIGLYILRLVRGRNRGPRSA